LHDAIAAERRGIPAAAVMTDRFVRSAEVVAQVNGLPDYPFAVIAHPVANDSDMALAAKAQIAAEQVVRILTQRRAPSGD
jgi:hypothetical protein